MTESIHLSESIIKYLDYLFAIPRDLRVYAFGFGFRVNAVRVFGVYISRVHGFRVRCFRVHDLRVYGLTVHAFRVN